ncbi:MAG: ribosome small subunit-dependent GTPase A [Gammaproteobacteria bacterium]|nr:ribosome small subunit-dependent GTPase A [Gammaproteobacteria bacterium]
MSDPRGDDALIIATFSRRMHLRLEDGAVVNARIKGKKLRPVCGDRVTAVPLDAEEDWLITAVAPRVNELSRQNTRGGHEVLAANLDCLAVVAAGVPAADWFVVDRYLAAAALMNASALLVFNKIDLVDELTAAKPALCRYSQAGYEVIETCADDGRGIAALRRALDGKTSIIVGQSGVGKSSLINRLSSAAGLRTAEISNARKEGRHTTVNSQMIDLPGGGTIVDSPGVRDFAPYIEEPASVARGFIEIDAAAKDCRFGNCRHLREPGCAVKRAVERAAIDERRYESYRRLLALTEKLTQDRF